MGGNFDIVAKRAARQHGRVAWRQLLDEGIDRYTIQRWLDDHRLHRVHDGVYAVRHLVPGADADMMAADLACGRGAVASHDSTAYLFSHEAWVRRGLTPEAVEACIARNPGKPGAAKLRRALGSDATLSKLEDGFLVLLGRHDLPRPRTNIDHQGDKVDCHWPAYGLTIELVSYRYHASRQAFEQDVARRRRSNHIQFSWGDVHERGAQTARDVQRLLAESGKQPQSSMFRARTHGYP